MADHQSLGGRIRALRRQQGLSQAQLAGDGISPSYVSLVEAGKRIPSPEVVSKLAVKLKCPESELLSYLGRQQDDELELEVRYAELALANGDAKHAVERFSALLERIGSSGNPGLTVGATWGLAQGLERSGKLEEAVRLYERLRTWPDGAAAERVDRTAVLIAVCRCYRELGDLGRAIDVGEQALAVLEQLDLVPSPEGIELISTIVGLYCERGDIHRASYLAEMAVERASALDNRKALGAAYWNASMVAYEAGRTSDALRLVQRAQALYAESDNERAVARLRTAHAAVLLQADPPQPVEARGLLTEAVESFRRIGGDVDMAYCQTELARVALLLAEPEEAESCALEALRGLGDGHRLEAARATLILGAARSAQGDAARARQAYERAALSLEASGAGRQAARVWTELAEFLDAQGEAERAVKAYREGMRCLGYQSSDRARGPLLKGQRSV
ncbi:helix-turn-helix domain-containing protein [Streptomyces sp. NPDC002935]|uniref:helix-turn-helix domain-containing protein n=1 Tax=unclassified Streptomyces TaxID=2593676 RepID=UPI00331F241B